MHFGRILLLSANRASIAVSAFTTFRGFNIVPWPRACYRVSSISRFQNSMSIAYRRARPLWFKGIKTKSPIIASNACRYKCHTISLNSFFLTILMVSARKMMISRPLSGSSDFPGTDTNDNQICRSFVKIFTIYSLITDWQRNLHLRVILGRSFCWWYQIFKISIRYTYRIMRLSPKYGHPRSLDTLPYFKIILESIQQWQIFNIDTFQIKRSHFFFFTTPVGQPYHYFRIKTQTTHPLHIIIV